jgi:hypothetical protein
MDSGLSGALSLVLCRTDASNAMTMALVIVSSTMAYRARKSAKKNVKERFKNIKAV